MSKVPEITTQLNYEHFSPVFYDVWGDDPAILGKAQAINRLIETYLYVYGADGIWGLPPEVQDYVNQESKLTINLGEVDD